MIGMYVQVTQKGLTLKYTPSGALGARPHPGHTATSGQMPVISAALVTKAGMTRKAMKSLLLLEAVISSTDEDAEKVSTFYSLSVKSGSALLSCMYL